VADSSDPKPEYTHTLWSATGAVMSVATPTVRNRLRFYALSITKDPGAADTLADEAIIRCAERMDLSKVRPDKILAYLTMILRNMAMSWCRRHRLQQNYLKSCDRHLTVQSEAESSAVSKETMKLFDDFVAREVPDPYRAVVTMRAVDGLTLGQISKKLGVPLGTVMSRMSRAREYLEGWFRYMKAE
jgi:RNA polymerase sigma factor (sigma-70 family)